MKIHNENLLENFYKHEKQNVAIVSDIFFPSLGGATFVVDNLAKHLQRRGNCNVVIITGQVKGHEDTVEYPVIRCKSIKIPKAFGDSLPMPKWDGKFKKLMKKLNLDVIHVHTVFGVATYTMKFGRKHNIPVIFHGHSKFNEEYMAITKSKFITNIMANRAFKIVNKADLVLTVSQNTKDVYTSQGVTKEMIVVSNATDMEPCNNDQAAFAFVEEKHGISKDKKNILLFVSRMEIKTKNIDFLFESLKNIKDKGIDFTLLMVGHGKDYDEIIKLSQELNLQDNVIMVGMVREREVLKYYYKRADLFVFPSVVDNCPLVKYEAGTQHTPTLAIEKTGSSEEIVNDVNGFTSAYSVESYTQRLYDILTNPAHLKEVSDNALQTLSKNWGHVAKTLEDIYQKISQEKAGK